MGGGNTKSMLAVWNEWGLDKILKKAYKDGIVMSGVSAGAICWFQNGITDSWDSNLKVMPCMNIVKELVAHIMMKSFKKISFQRS